MKMGLIRLSLARDFMMWLDWDVMRNTLIRKLFSLHRRCAGRFLIAAITAAIFGACATNPVSKKKQLVFMSEEQEIAMGKEADPQIIAQFGLYEDHKLQDFINAKGQQMAGISHRPKLEYHFRIVDSEVLNAFAVPGGYVLELNASDRTIVNSGAVGWHSRDHVGFCIEQ